MSSPPSLGFNIFCPFFLEYSYPVLLSFIWPIPAHRLCLGFNTAPSKKPCLTPHFQGLAEGDLFMILWPQLYCEVNFCGFFYFPSSCYVLPMPLCPRNQLRAQKEVRHH